MFIITIYHNAWYTPMSNFWFSQQPNSAEAAGETYKTINESVANTELKSFTGQLWYLSESGIGMAFFDSNVPGDVKTGRMTALSCVGVDQPRHRIELDSMTVAEITFRLCNSS